MLLFKNTIFVKKNNFLIVIILFILRIFVYYNLIEVSFNYKGGVIMDTKKIAILTGGGDCPGLNAVIRAVTRTAILKYGYEVIGYKYGYRGLYKNDFIPLTLDTVSGILHRGGTILYSSNKDNLFDYAVEENGKIVKKDVSDVAVENLKKKV